MVRHLANAATTAVAVAGLILLAGCGVPALGSGFNGYVVGATPKHAPVRGVLYTGVQGFENVTENPVGPALPKACVTGISGWPLFFLSWINIAWGSSSTNGLDANKKISIVDNDMFSVLGIFGQHCNVYHDGGSGPETGVPATPVQPGAAPLPTVPPVNAPTTTVPAGAQPQPAAPPAGKTI